MVDFYKFAKTTSFIPSVKSSIPKTPLQASPASVPKVTSVPPKTVTQAPQAPPELLRAPQEPGTLPMSQFITQPRSQTSQVQVSNGHGGSYLRALPDSPAPTPQTANARAKFDESSYATKGTAPPTYQAKPGISFTPTNEEQAQRMGVKTQLGNFRDPQAYKAPGYGVLQKSGSVKVSTWTLFNEIASRIVWGELAKTASEASNGFSGAPSKIQTPVASTPPPTPPRIHPEAKPITYGGKPVVLEKSFDEMDRDAESKTIRGLNSKILDREKSQTQDLFSQVNNLKRDIGQNRADQINFNSEASHRIDRDNKVIDYANKGVPRELINPSLARTPQVTASQGYEDLQKSSPQRPTVSQLEKAYSDRGFGVHQTERATEAMVDEAGQGMRGDNEAYLRNNMLDLKGQLPLHWRPQYNPWTVEEPESGVSSFYKSMAQK